MEFRALRYFVTIAEVGSFSSAARLLHVAQPALSRQIHNLERELGVPLFRRTARGLLLTDSGRQLLGDGRQILEAAEQATARIRQDAKGVREPVSVALTSSASMILTVPLLRTVERDLPSISLSIVESMVGSGSEWLNWIRDRHLDLAVMYDVEKQPELRSETVLVEELRLVGKFGQRRTGSPVPFAALAKYPLVLPSRIFPLRQMIDRAAQQAGVELQVVDESNSTLEVKRMIRRGKVYSILTPCAVWEERRHKELFAARIVEPSLSRRLNIISLAGSVRSPAVRTILDQLKLTMRQLVEAGSWDARLT
ncbi:MAG TPA: LysR family transcriptional regulator [Hypericibacter adhaerens]|jgi:DNA-binding transcriptional LysR family regulator|uniref:LysR family transcriptional regulator n=1 Tax=Hypericibacter adhaerens TaxID=2602016 RepID=UPI002B773C6C|nr:LysR family transcriptional regulator [Hypericibacter adhaerens]HWA42203.1 LysR family transcriptional regulator [Hypericibacter adhaerens]